MTISRRFEHHDEVVELHEILTAAWATGDPNSGPALHPASYSETFLDMARAVTQSGYHRAALDQAASDRAALDRVIAAATQFQIGDEVSRAIDAALRDEQDASAGRTDWVDDAAPLPRPDGSSDA